MQPLTIQEINKLYEQDNIIKFYKHPYWRKHIRILALERDNSECQECKRNGKYSKGGTSITSRSYVTDQT